MNQPTLSIGTKVIRIGSAADSSTGRTGEIVEIDAAKGRYRVFWTTEKSGRPVLNSHNKPGVRTWVKYEFVGAL